MSIRLRPCSSEADPSQNTVLRPWIFMVREITSVYSALTS